MKIIRVEMPDGSIWRVNAERVAKHYADWSTFDNEESDSEAQYRYHKDSPQWHKRYLQALISDLELSSWASFMRFQEAQPVMVSPPPPPPLLPDYNAAYEDATFTVEEVEEEAKKVSHNSKKALRIEMPDGSVWHAGALPIAEDRANYYAHKVDGEEIGSERWKDELAYTLEDETELREWALNNMNWDDLKAVMVKPPKPPDYHKMWMDAEFDLVDD